MQIFDTNYVRHEVSFFVTNFLDIETAALARAYLGIGGGTGDVIATVPLTLNQLVVGGGGFDVKILASPADATKFLNGAASPAFAAVKDSDLSLSNIATNNVSIARHGFAPILPNDATKFLDGTGAYTTPVGGSGTVTNTGNLVDHGVVVGNGLADVSTIAVGVNNTVLRGSTGADPAFGNVVEGDILLSNVSTNDASSTKHGFAPISPADATKFLNGASTPAYALVKDSDLSTSNVTTNNVTIAKHGFAPILPNDATKYLDGTGAYSVPGGGGGSGTVTNSGVLTDHGVIVGNSGVDVSALAVGTTNTLLHGVTGADPAFSAVVEADLSLTNVTTADVSITKHGFAPKAPNDPTKYLDGTGAYSTPSGGGGGTDSWDSTFEARIYCNPGAAGLTGAYGCQLGATGTNVTNSPGTASQLSCVDVASSATTSGTLFGLGSNSTSSTTGSFMFGFPGLFVTFVTPISSTAVRFVFGMTALTDANQLASGSPTGVYAMFRYSPAEGDVVWQAIVGDGSSTEVISTGVAVSNSAMVRLAILWDGTAANSFDFYIDGTKVADGTLNPSATTLMKMAILGKLTAGGTAKSFRMAEMKCRATYP